MSKELYRVGKRVGQERWQIKVAPNWKVVAEFVFLKGCADWLQGGRIDISKIPVLLSQPTGVWPMLSDVLREGEIK
ncbi:MAG: hypothetical protein HY343_00635 [Lentisphaerae bacterium]|nr:hypothetical protein [Lentisphaerota bacterium]